MSIELLMVAIKNNDVDKCGEILKKADLNLNESVNGAGSDTMIYTTPLTYAARYGSIQIIKMLLKSGANPNYGIINERRARPLYTAVQEQREIDIVKVLIEAGADINYNEDYSLPPTVLHIAVRDSRIELIKILLDAGADPNNSDQSWENPLLHEILQSKKPSKTKIVIVELLIGAGADVNAKNHSGMTPLHYAKSKSLIKFLIENDADPRIANKRGKQIIDSPGVKQVYMEYIMSRVKLANAKQRLAFATMLISPNHIDKPKDLIAEICQSLDIPPFDAESKDKANAILIKQLQQELQEEMNKKIREKLREQFPGEKIDNMIEFYRKQLQNPNLIPEHRKELKRKKRTRKIRQGIPLGSSDLSSSRKSRSLTYSENSRESRSFNSEEELKRAIKISIHDARSGSKKKKKMKKSKKKRKSSKKSK